MSKGRTQYNWFDAEAFTPWNQLAQLNKTALAELTAQQIELGRSLCAASVVSAAREAKSLNELLHAQGALLCKPYELGIQGAQKACEWLEKWAAQFLACWEKTVSKPVS